MMNPGLRRFLLSACAAAALGGCNGSQMAVNPSGIAQPSMGSSNERGDRFVRRSWMAPQAARDDLLYVSDPGSDTVDVYSYPEGAQVGALTGFKEPWGVCVDRTGDVFIADNWHFRVVEYAHAGLIPLAVLHHRGGHPTQCSVDRLTGDLAVTYYYLTKNQSSEVAVFPRAKGTPIVFRGEKRLHWSYWSCTYDDAGNLFVDGTYGTESTSVGLVELPTGGNKLVTIELNQFFEYLGALGWDGKHLAMATQGFGSEYPATIYEFDIKGTSGTEVGSTPLDAADRVDQFWIQGRKVVAPVEQAGTLMLYEYPKGGAARKTIGGLTSPFGATISRAN